jgi:hypothetical protein
MEATERMPTMADPQQPEVQPADEQTAADASRPSAFISERHRNPAEMQAVQPRGRDNWAGMIAILTLLAFGATLMLLWMDWTKLKFA